MKARNSWMVCMRSNEQGLTLIELLAVLAIAAILVLTIGTAWTRQDNATASATLTQKILIMMRQARTRAQESGSYTQVWIDTTGKRLTLVESPDVGYTPPVSGSWIVIAQEQAGQEAEVQSVQPGIKSGSFSGPVAANTTITFRPDGSACLAVGTNPIDGPAGSSTIFVRDGATKHPNRVVVYGLTGYSRSLPGWEP